MADAIWKWNRLVNTCTLDGMVGRLAERRLILKQPVEKTRRHGTAEDLTSTAKMLIMYYPLVRHMSERIRVIPLGDWAMETT